MGLRNWGHGTLIGEWRQWKGVDEGPLLPGFITVQNPLRITNAADDAIVPVSKLIDRQPLNIDEDLALADGKSAEVVLPATDDPDIEQDHPGFTVEVDLGKYGVEVYNGVKILEGGETNLRTLIPTVRATPIPTASLNLNMFARVVNGLIVDKDGNPITSEIDWQAGIDLLAGA